jgi:hypothetical protein
VISDKYIKTETVLADTTLLPRIIRWAPDAYRLLSWLSQSPLLLLVVIVTLSLLWLTSLSPLSWSPYQWLPISDSVSISLVTLSVTIVMSHPGYDSIVSPFVIPSAQTCIYTSLLAPLWRQVESLVNFLETETLLPISFPHFPQSASWVGLRVWHYLGYNPRIGLGVLSSSLSHST